MDNLKQLYEKRARIHEQMKDTIKYAETETSEGRNVPQEKWDEYDKWDTEYKSLTETINRLKKFEEVEAADEAREEERQEVKPDAERRDKKAEYSEAFRRYALYGQRALSNEQVDMLESNFRAAAGIDNEFRAATASSTTTTAGGYTIPEDFSYEVEKAMAYYGPFVLDAPNAPFRQWNSPSGADLPWPTVDDTSNTGELLAESGDATTNSTGITWGVETLKAYALSSNLIPVTKQIIQDSGVGFLQILQELLGERLGRVMNTYCTTGTGSSQPEGCTIGSTQGASTASSTAFTQSELMDFLYSVDKAYRSGPKVGFMMHPTIVGEVRKLDISTSNYTQPLFQPSLSADVPDRLLGYPYWENSDMASTLTTGQKIMMFGDWNKFVIRRVRGMEFLRSDDRYFEKLQVAYLGWMRMDSRVMQENALKYFELT